MIAHRVAFTPICSGLFLSGFVLAAERPNVPLIVSSDNGAELGCYGHGHVKSPNIDRLVHDWSFQNFPDPDHGEWNGYLYRDGRLSVPIRGNIWKGPFHLPRMLLACWQILAETG